MARMMPVDEEEIYKAGYLYNSSLNPTWIPGRYNNLKRPRSWFFDHKVLQIPASVSNPFRFPLFWLTFHNLPLWIIKNMSTGALAKDGYLNLYFHPWEFTDLDQPEKFGFPKYVTKNSGDMFVHRISSFIQWAQARGEAFKRTCDFAIQVVEKHQQ